MSPLELEGVFAGALQGATLAIPAGLTVVLATPADGGADLLLVAGGLLVPRRGTVRVGGLDPSSSPAARARLGLVLAEEPPLAAPSLAEAVRQVLALRGQAADPRALLERHGLGSLAGISPERAGSQARRHLAWALALELAEPHALLVHEPLSLGPLASRERTRAELSARAESGVPILAVTASPRDASELGGSLVLLDRGRFVRRPGQPLATELVPGASATLSVHTPAARALARALVDDPAVASLEWGEEEIRVRGADVDSLSLAVLRHARALSAPLSSIGMPLPALEEVRAATAGLWRAAYDAAFRTATAQARQREEALTRQRAASAPQPPPSTEGGSGT